MSDKLENELASLLVMRYADDPFNYTSMYSKFFESNKEEFKNSSIWDDIRSIASEELEYKIKNGYENIVNEFLEEMKFYYKLWRKIP